MNRLRAIFIRGVVVLLAAPHVQAQQARTVVITAAAPVYVSPNDMNQTPLITAQAGSVVRLLGTDGDWWNIEFEDPQYGRRVGYVRSRYARIAETAPDRVPVDVSVPGLQQPPPHLRVQPLPPPQSTPVERAADPKVEVGASFVTITVPLESNSGVIVGVPSSGFGILQPGVYFSFFAGPHVAIEPQLGLILASSGGVSEHAINFAGQLDYFAKGTSVSSPYAFGTVGVLDLSGTSVSPKSVGGGAGYWILAGDRLTFRVEVRLMHMTDGGGNTLSFGVNIGGLFR